MSRPAKGAKGAKGAQAAFGGIPRVDLLPAEVRASQKAGRQRVWMVVGVIGALAVTGGIYGYALFVQTQAEAALEAEQDRTVFLLSQQAQYNDVRTVTLMAALVSDAQQAGAYTEILWTPFVAEVQATLPSDVEIVEFDIASATLMQPLAQPASPLMAPRVATIVFTAQSPDLPNVREWLDALTAVTGFTEATPGSVSLNDSTGLYEASITMGVDENAWSGRFVPEEPETGDDSDESASESDEG